MRAATTLLLALLLALAAAPAGATPTAPWEKSGVDWSKAPAMAKQKPFLPPKPQRTKLKNGMTLVVIENHRLPLVSLRLVVRDAGAAQDPAGKGGLAAFTADMLDEGAGALGPLVLDESFAALGADLSVGAGDDSASMSMDTLARTLDDSLVLFQLVLQRPRFDEKEAVRVLGDRVTNLELLPDRPREVASLILYGVLYGFQGIYGRPVSGTLAEVKGLTVADARAFYEARWTPDRMTLVVAGDVDAKALAAKLDQMFGPWKPKGQKPVAAKPKAEPVKVRLFMVDRPDAEQADVRAGVVAIDGKAKTLPEVQVLANVLGGTFTSRLNRRLREELGWTYGARAGLQLQAGTSPFVVSTALVTPHAVEGVKEILAILQAVVDADLPADELERAKQNLIRELPQRFASNAEAVGAYAELVMLGLPDNFWAGYEKRIAKVTAKQVRTAAKQLLGKGTLVIVVVGDAKLLRPGLEALGLGPVTMLGPDGTPR